MHNGCSGYGREGCSLGLANIYTTIKSPAMFYFIHYSRALYYSAAHWKKITISLKRLIESIVSFTLFDVNCIIDMNRILEDDPPAKACILHDLLGEALDSFGMVLVVEQTSPFAEKIPVSQIHVYSVTHEMVTAAGRFILGAL